MNVISATYAEALSTTCKTCPAGYSCPENKRTEICPFDDSLGYFYSTDSSKLSLIKFASNLLFSTYLF